LEIDKVAARAREVLYVATRSAGSSQRLGCIWGIRDYLFFSSFLIMCKGTPSHQFLQDTVTGFLMAGVGNVDLRKKTNYLLVDNSE
jgi:hypothetical protein